MIIFIPVLFQSSGRGVVVFIHPHSANGGLQLELLKPRRLPSSEFGKVREIVCPVVVTVPDLEGAQNFACLAAFKNRLPVLNAGVDPHMPSPPCQYLGDICNKLAVSLGIQSFPVATRIGVWLGFDPNCVVEFSVNSLQKLFSLACRTFSSAGSHLHVSQHASCCCIVQVLNGIGVDQSSPICTMNNRKEITLRFNALVCCSLEGQVRINALQAVQGNYQKGQGNDDKYSHCQQDRTTM